MSHNNRFSKVKGTKKLVYKSQLLVSLGLPSLDAIIGGGLPVGNIFLIEEDEFGIFSNMIVKHYLAEGLISNHSVLLASQDTDCQKLISELPSPLHYELDTSIDQDKSAGKLRIAWRYENLSLDQTVNSNTSIFGNAYCLGTPMKSSFIEKADVNQWDGIILRDIHNDNYVGLLTYIENLLKERRCNFHVPAEDRTVLRIALISLNTGCWTGNIVRFLIKLRFLLRDSCATCFISIHPKLFENGRDISRCEHLCDTIVQLKSLLNEGNSLYEDYSGIMIVKKLSNVNNWSPIVPETDDWAFKLKKKRLIVEKLHTSPELKEHDHREEKDISHDYSVHREQF